MVAGEEMKASCWTFFSNTSYILSLLLPTKKERKNPYKFTKKKSKLNKIKLKIRKKIWKNPKIYRKTRRSIFPFSDLNLRTPKRRVANSSIIAITHWTCPLLPPSRNSKTKIDLKTIDTIITATKSRFKCLNNFW